MNDKTYVIYSTELRGFLSDDGLTLTEDITKAMYYQTIGHAMIEASKATERLKGTFRFHIVQGT